MESFYVANRPDKTCIFKNVKAATNGAFNMSQALEIFLAKGHPGCRVDKGLEVGRR
jgi:hypothetical protein